MLIRLLRAVWWASPGFSSRRPWISPTGLLPSAVSWLSRQVSVSLDLIVLGLPVHDPAWIAAVGGLITACGGVAGGAIGAMLFGCKHTDAKLEVIKGLAAEAKEQTTNNHGTNMRDDLDALGDKLDALGERLGVVAKQVAAVAHTQQLQSQELKAHGMILDQLQAAQQQDRAERFALDSHAHDEHERIWKELDRLKKRLWRRKSALYLRKIGGRGRFLCAQEKKSRWEVYSR